MVVSWLTYQSIIMERSCACLTHCSQQTLVSVIHPCHSGHITLQLSVHGTPGRQGTAWQWSACSIACQLARWCCGEIKWKRDGNVNGRTQIIKWYAGIQWKSKCCWYSWEQKKRFIKGNPNLLFTRVFIENPCLCPLSLSIISVGVIIRIVCVVIVSVTIVTQTELDKAG